MGLAVNTNIAALNAYRNLSNTQNDLSKSMEKLSSGLRINRAADDAAGLAISEGLRAQVTGLNQAQRNAQDGISVIQTAEGALTEVHDILQRMRELTVQGANDTNSPDARSAIDGEIGALAKELDRIVDNTEFNGIKLLKGDGQGAGAALNFSVQVGAGSGEDNQIVIALKDIGAALSGITDADGASQLLLLNPGTASADGPAADAATNLTALDTAIKSISTARADYGAQQNRLESSIRSLSVSSENLSAAESRIRDTDMAQEMVKYTAKNILSQAGTAMLAQANQSTQGVLQLLG
ncbi:flagellin [Microbacterium sediminis]|uniref:Flagellin n=1 Tax=Microbacterium sediminis TaxID=904291 RepID=A0A1B9NIZ8_9MICO|nr:flagellin [Microbacterium sediminis]OCG76556.1 flagellin [Microbacterium sediminis]QBR73840.1 flagellin [Microbacterium sediminis]